MPRPRIHDDDTADALVAEAARRLRSGGPDAVGVRAVADAVGVSTRAVYSLFGSREKLLAELYRRGFAGLAHELASRPRTDHPMEDLREVGDAYRRSALARPNLYYAMFGGAGFGQLEAGATEDGADSAGSRATFEVLVGAVARCVDADLLVGEPELLARQLWALTHGLVLLELDGALGDHPDTVWTQALTAMVAGHAGPALIAGGRDEEA